MDKNFVNIDDLVRQRLGGGEEQERSGAWLRMQNVLDKEMPQEERAGFFYWRRMLSAVAVLLLIASITVGGYELSANRNGKNTAPTNAVTTAVRVESTNNTNSNTPVNNEVNKDQLMAAGVVASTNSHTKINSNDNRQSLIANDTHIKERHDSKRAVASDRPNSTVSSNSELVNDHAPVAASTVTDNSTIASERKTAAVAKTNPVDNVGSNNKTANTNKATASVSPSVSPIQKNKIAETPMHKTAAGVPTPATVVSNEIAPMDVAATKTSDKSTKPSEKKVVNASGSKIAGADNKTDVADSKLVAVVKKDAHRKATTPKVSTEKGVEKMNELHLSSHTSSIAKPKAIAINKVAVTGAAIPEPKVNTPKAIAAKANKKIANGKTLGATPAPVNAPMPVAANTPKAAKSAKHAAGNVSAMKNVTAVNEQKDKTVLQKLVLYEHEHYIKTNPNDGYFNLDTISMQMVNQAPNITEPLSTPLPAEKKVSKRYARRHANATANATAANTPPSATSTAAAKGAPANNTVASAGNASASGATTSASSQILPGASASSNGKPAMGVKQNTSSKSTGSAALENLGSTFNDIKYKASAVQFAPGLSAGINGTFFGPSSFKGFQFGITGDFIFGNDWAFATELKYFQRANNSYSLDDNAYSYTANGTGGFNKVQTTNTYSFSTLHSIEMPLIVRYTAGKFNFFVGGNLVYTFSINEGYIQTETQSITPTNGQNTTAKLDESDFNSRFGFGCIFGVSYNVAPNFTVDLRNVMTLWDNANSAGSKYVSEQLYKSPSIQLSLGYRLGGNKHKE